MLMEQLQIGDCTDQYEYRLAKELHALPLGIDLVSYVFLDRTGEVIWALWEPREVTRTRCEGNVMAAFLYALERYPILARFK